MWRQRTYQYSTQCQSKDSYFSDESFLWRKRPFLYSSARDICLFYRPPSLFQDTTRQRLFSSSFNQFRSPACSLFLCVLLQPVPEPSTQSVPVRASSTSSRAQHAVIPVRVLPVRSSQVCHQFHYISRCSLPCILIVCLPALILDRPVEDAWEDYWDM